MLPCRTPRSQRRTLRGPPRAPAPAPRRAQPAARRFYAPQAPQMRACRHANVCAAAWGAPAGVQPHPLAGCARLVPHRRVWAQHQRRLGHPRTTVRRCACWQQARVHARARRPGWHGSTGWAVDCPKACMLAAPVAGLALVPFIPRVPASTRIDIHTCLSVLAPLPIPYLVDPSAHRQTPHPHPCYGPCLGPVLPVPNECCTPAPCFPPILPLCSAWLDASVSRRVCLNCDSLIHARGTIACNAHRCICRRRMATCHYVSSAR